MEERRQHELQQKDAEIRDEAAVNGSTTSSLSQALQQYGEHAGRTSNVAQGFPSAVSPAETRLQRVLVHPEALNDHPIGPESGKCLPNFP